MEEGNSVMSILEGLTHAVHEFSRTVASQYHDFRAMVMEQLQHQQNNREFKIEGAFMPTFHGKPYESVDEFVFEAKLFMNGKNIDYTRAENQARVVAMLAANLRFGAASWYHSRIVIDDEPIHDIDEFEQALKDEFAPSDQQQRLRAALRSCKQTGSVEEYVAQFRHIIAQVRDMSQIDKVDHFVSGLKPETQKEVNYLCCASLKQAVTAAQAYERAYFSGNPMRRPRQLRAIESEPMDISQVMSRPTNEQCRRQGLCFYCREGGHRIASCPKNRQETSVFSIEEAAGDARCVIGASVCAMEIRLDKVQVQGDGLLFVKAKVQDQSLQMLVNSGATHCIVRRDLLCLPAHALQLELQARDFEGEVKSTLSRQYDVNMLITGRSCSFAVVEWPLQQDFDGILGQTWLQRENPAIDWAQRRLAWAATPSRPQLPREWTHLPASKPEIEYVNVGQFKASLRAGQYAEVFHLDVVAEYDKPKPDAKIERLIREFADFLREELPDSLPPERDIEHSLHLKPDARPSSRPPFRHAHVKQEALQHL